MEFLGGIDPKLVLWGFLITGLAIVDVACVCIYFSLHAKTTTLAIVSGFFYPVMVGACGTSVPLFILPSFFCSKGTPDVPWQIMVMNSAIAAVTFLISAFLLITAVRRLRKVFMGFYRPVPQGCYPSAGELPSGLPGFIEIFPVHESSSELARPVNRPPVSDSPILWREYSSKRISFLLAAYGLIFLFFICSGSTSERIGALDSDQPIRKWAPFAIAIVTFPVGILSSRMIAKERQGGTLDTLLITALEPEEILWSKCKASILPVFWPFVFLMAYFAMAGLTDGISPFAFISMILATLIYIAFFACLALLISTYCGTTLKAMLIFTVIFLAFGLGGAVYLEPLSESPGQFPRAILRVAYYAFSPLSTLRELTFNERRAIHNPGEIVAALVALGVVALVTWGLWKLTVFCFERSTGGGPLLRRSFAKVVNTGTE
jgi:ABC-type transport system involved in multi-copper enzyme maturation permease subunit